MRYKADMSLTHHRRPLPLRHSFLSQPPLNRFSPVRRPRSQRLLAALLALWLTGPLQAPPAQSQNNSLPSLGDAASDDFSLGAERKLGDEIMRDIRRDPDYIDDPILLEYLQSLWQPLVAAARARGEVTPDLEERFAYEPFLVRDRSVNAFALPGGFVGVHLGLMAMTSTADELASVLAHEMTHVNQRHIARSLANSKRVSLLSAAALILGVLAASRSGNADATNAVIAGSQAAGIQGQLNFSRDMEREADRIGYQVMTTAGFAPGGMAAMFDKLQQASRLNDFGGFPYLRSHPLTTERIGEARARMGLAADAAPASSLPPRSEASLLEHSLAQARARVLMDPRVSALRRWQAQDADNTAAARAERLGAAYEIALASTLLRDWPRADAALAKAGELLRGAAHAEPRAQRALDLLTAQSALERGDLPRAAAALQPHDEEMSRPVLLLAAQAALAAPPNGSALRRSADRLQTWVTSHDTDADAWSTLGRLWARLGQPLRALRAEAESRNAVGDLTGALDRLRAGQRLARSGASGTPAAAADFIESSVIDSRVRTLEAKRRQQVIDERAAGNLGG